MHPFSSNEQISLGCTKMKLVVTQLEECHMTKPCPPSICETSQAETAISSMIFRTGILIDSLLAGCGAARSVSYSLADQVGEGQTLAALAFRCRRLRRPRFVNVLPLPCRVSRPGQAEVTLPSFPQLSQLDFAWLMNCDGTQLQGCLCCFFFSHQASQSEQECETLLNSADGSQPSYQLARLHP